MIDGFKIQCRNIQVEQWTENPLLEFYFSNLNEVTGEVSAKITDTSKYKGLLFRLTRSSNGGFYKTITGSLHKYFNDGLHNANEFKLSDLQNTISDLEKNFSVQADKSDLKNLEIGINISLPISVKEFLDYIIGMPTKKFTEMNVNKFDLGKICSFGELQIKLYDKGKQSNLKIDNFLRVEIKIKRTRYLNKLGIYTLADLRNPKKLIRLYYLLYKTFSDILIYERNIDETKLTDGQLIYLLRHRDPIYWKKMSKQNRHNHKVRFNEFLHKHSTPKIKDFILNEIDKKTNELTDEIQKQETESKRQILTFSQYKCSSQRSNPNDLKNKKKEVQKCRVCECDISHKRTGKKYCSSKCRNKYNNTKRLNEIHEKRNNELLKLSVLKQELHKTNYNLLIFKKSDTGITKSRKKQADIKPLKYQDLRKIIKVNLFIDRKTFEFTTLRAKELIKVIYQLNIKSVEKYNCLECNKKFVPKRKDAKYCSKKCKNKSSNRTRDAKRKLQT